MQVDVENVVLIGVHSFIVNNRPTLREAHGIRRRRVQCFEDFVQAELEPFEIAAWRTDLPHTARLLRNLERLVAFLIILWIAKNEELLASKWVRFIAQQVRLNLVQEIKEVFSAFESPSFVDKCFFVHFVDFEVYENWHVG